MAKKATLSSINEALLKIAQSTAAEKAEAKGLPQLEAVATVAAPASQPGVSDPQVAPASARTASGGVDNPAPGLKTDPQGSPAPVPVTQKPAEKGDIDKEASVEQLAQGIVSSIVAYNQQKEAAAPAPAPATATRKEAAPARRGLNIELTTDVLSKIACIMLASEDGAAFVQTKLAEHLGKAAADDVEAFLGDQADMLQKKAEADAALADYQEGIRQAEELIKYAQEQGIPLEALLGEDGGAEDMEGAMQPAPEALAAGAEAAPEVGIPEDDEPISLEEIITVLQELVSEGAITPEIAAGLVEQLTGEGGDDLGGEEGGEDIPEPEYEVPAATATPEMPDEEKKEEQEKKEASAHRLSLALEHFNQYAPRR